VTAEKKKIINKGSGGRAPKSSRHERADTLFGVIPAIFKKW
jgi:hypothetical protein